MPTTGKLDQRYFVEGQEAHRSGKPKEENPYDVSNPAAARDWDDGWDSEQNACYGGDT
jgi:hypothetical protein